MVDQDPSRVERTNQLAANPCPRSLCLFRAPQGQNRRNLTKQDAKGHNYLNLSVLAGGAVSSCGAVGSQYGCGRT